MLRNRQTIIRSSLGCADDEDFSKAQVAASRESFQKVRVIVLVVLTLFDMAQRCILAVSVSVVVFLLVSSSEAAPAFKFKKSFSAYDADRSRVERRLSGGASPIHYITPFMGMPMNTLNSFFAPASPMGNPSSSSVYKLPLRLFANGKPNAVFHGFPKAAQNVVDYLPQAMSNIIRLPLKYLSNAKPIGVYFKDPAFNYL